MQNFFISDRSQRKIATAMAKRWWNNNCYPDQWEDQTALLQDENIAMRCEELKDVMDALDDCNLMIVPNDGQRRDWQI
jgi:hypothetical protein